MPSQFQYVYGVGLHLGLLYLWAIKKNKLYGPSWSHLVVLNSVPLDQESSILTIKHFI